MLKRLVVLALVSVAMLMAADAPPAPVVKPVPIAEVDLLRLQVQAQAMQLLDQAFQKVQGDLQKMQADFKVKEAARDASIRAIYEKAKVKIEDFDLDFEHGQLIPKPKPAAAAPALRQQSKEARWPREKRFASTICWNSPAACCGSLT